MAGGEGGGGGVAYPLESARGLLSHHGLIQVLNNWTTHVLTPKFKKYILPTFKREMYKWGNENWK